MTAVTGTLVWLHWFLDRLRHLCNLSVVSRGRGGLVGGSGVSVSLLGLWGVDGGALVGDISDESVDVISGVGGGLDSAVRKSNHEATGNDTVGILCFCLLEVSLAVVISNSVLISERLRGELLRLVGSRGGGIGRGRGVGHGDLVGDGDSHESSGESNLRKHIH